MYEHPWAQMGAVPGGCQCVEMSRFPQAPASRKEGLPEAQGPQGLVGGMQWVEECLPNIHDHSEILDCDFIWK